MEDNFFKLIQIVNSINATNNKLYAKIEYIADENKNITITIVSKESYTYVETLKADLSNNPFFKWDSLFNSLNSYIGGATNE